MYAKRRIFVCQAATPGANLREGRLEEVRLPKILRHQGLCMPSLASALHSIGASLVGPLLCVIYRRYTLEGNQEHPVSRAHGAVCVLLYVSGPDQIEQAAVEGFGVHAKTLRCGPRVHATTCAFSYLLPHNLQ